MDFFKKKIKGQLKATCQVFSDLINIISMKYSIKRGIEVIQQSHNLQVKKKDDRKLQTGNENSIL